MDSFKNIKVERAGNRLQISLNRPEVRNAMNRDLIDELTRAIEEAKNAELPRVLLISGEGPVFCAGADVQYMKDAQNLTTAENLKDAEALGGLFFALYDFPAPTILRVQKAAIGGALGLVGAADLVLADEKAVFAFTEVLLGIAPAVISPFVIRRTGGAAKRLFLTGERIDAVRARELRLVDETAPLGELDALVERYVKQLLSGGPSAQRVIKRLVRGVTWMPLEESRPFAAGLISELRASEEALEGFNAFFEKRKPSWADED